jgi:hypothetical protein
MSDLWVTAHEGTTEVRRVYVRPADDLDLLAAVRHAVEDGTIELNHEAAAKAIYDYGLPTATHDKRGRRVPFDEAMMTDSFRQAARAAVDAALSDIPVSDGGSET